MMAAAMSAKVLQKEEGAMLVKQKREERIRGWK